MPHEWLTKTLTLKLEAVAANLIYKTEVAFMKNRNIMNVILALHEILEGTKRRKFVGLVLKLQYLLHKSFLAMTSLLLVGLKLTTIIYQCWFEI